MRASNRISGAASVLAMTSAVQPDVAKRPGNNRARRYSYLLHNQKTFGLACYGADRHSHVKGDAGRQLRAELLNQVTDQLFHGVTRPFPFWTRSRPSDVSRGTQRAQASPLDLPLMQSLILQ